MTAAVALCRPDDVLRAAALLGGSADTMGTAVAAARRAAAVDWVGGPGENYQERLARLADGLVGMRSAFESACDALLTYGLALRSAQALAEESDRLLLAGPGAYPTRAAALAEEAAASASDAALRLAHVLDDLTSRAPHVRAFGLQQGLAHFAQGLASAASGVGSTVSSLFHALPGVGSSGSRHEARNELAAAAVDALQPWKQVQELYDAIRDGHGWYMAGELIPSLALRTRLRILRAHGDFLDETKVPAPVMVALTRGSEHAPEDVLVDQQLVAHLRRELVDALERFTRVPLPDLDALLSRRVDLLRQEAYGGHVLQRHIGRDADYLMERLRDEGNNDPAAQRSSFTSLDEAESVVTGALRVNEASIKAWLATRVRRLQITAPLSAPVGLVMDSSYHVIPAARVVVVLNRIGDAVVIKTAFVEG